LKELYDDKTVEGLSRYQNVQELLNAIKEFVDNPENAEDKSLGNFLQTVSLLTTADNKEDAGDNDRVTMMTIHGAKGLEFNHVYIVGLEEDLFPSQMMIQSKADLEEERRLFYVAITRAEKKLFISFAESRYQWGRLKPCEPSRFLQEIDQKWLNFAKNTKRAFEEKSRPSAMSFVRTVATKVTAAASLGPKPTPITSQHVASDEYAPSDTSKLEAGQKVEHIKFGYGVVNKVETNGMDRKAVIMFEKIGEKTLLLSFAKLRIM
jgi:DNA helicase-2/ATP-dependent DNA helicase PcrA